MIKTSYRAGTCVTLLLLLAACTPENDELSAIDSQTLTNRAYKCERVTEPAPGYAIACKNIYRECERRSSALGYKLC